MSTPAPRLSVVVPTYRAPQRLAALLDSLAVQTVDGAPGGNDAEVIVVDDGSPDFETAAWSQRAAPLATTVLHFDRNRGRAAARNAGIEAAGGDVVVFLDGDMTAAPGFLAAHTAFHAAHERAVAVGAIRWAEQVPDTAVTRYVHRRGVARFGPGPVPFNCFITGNSSVPRAVLNELGGFDEGLSTYGGEDLDLGYRLHRAGLTVHSHPEALSYHHGWRDLDGMCAAMASYGRGSLPRLLARHPELAGVLRLDFPALPAWHPRRWILRLALTSPLRAALRRLAALGQRGRWLPDAALSALWWAERSHAYLEATGDRMGGDTGAIGDAEVDAEQPTGWRNTP